MLATVPFLAKVLPEPVPPRTRELDRDGNSLLMLAASNGHEELLNGLFNSLPALANEAYLEDSVGETSILSASGSLSVRINIEEKNREGMNALCMATQRGHYATVKLLIDNGAKCHGALVSRRATGDDAITPLWLAARLTECAAPDGGRNDANQVRHSPELLVDLLLKNGAAADLDTPSWQGQTPLIAAAGAGRHAVLKLLIDAGAEVNKSDAHRLTPLMHAAHHGHFDAVEMLLNHGAQVDPRPGRLSALILAAESGRDRIVSLLSARGGPTSIMRTRAVLPPSSAQPKAAMSRQWIC
ncbi:MAG: ankyrin repeat domain-containing protein [Noviherbaspirillum sp.]